MRVLSKQEKDFRLNIRVSPTFRKRLRTVADALEMSASQIIRDAVTEKIVGLEKRVLQLRASKPQSNHCLKNAAPRSERTR